MSNYLSIDPGDLTHAMSVMNADPGNLTQDDLSSRATVPQCDGDSDGDPTETDDEEYEAHWTDAFPKGTNLTDQGDGQPYIWARNE